MAGPLDDRMEELEKTLVEALPSTDDLQEMARSLTERARRLGSLVKGDEYDALLKAHETQTHEFAARLDREMGYKEKFLAEYQAKAQSGRAEDIRRADRAQNAYQDLFSRIPALQSAFDRVAGPQLLRAPPVPPAPKASAPPGPAPASQWWSARINTPEGDMTRDAWWNKEVDTPEGKMSRHVAHLRQGRQPQGFPSETDRLRAQQEHRDQTAPVAPPPLVPILYPTPPAPPPPPPVPPPPPRDPAAIANELRQVIAEGRGGMAVDLEEVRRRGPGRKEIPLPDEAEARAQQQVKPLLREYAEEVARQGSPGSAAGGDADPMAKSADAYVKSVRRLAEENERSLTAEQRREKLKEQAWGTAFGPMGRSPAELARGMVGLAMRDPVLSRITSMFKGTTSGILEGYRTGGVAGATAGGFAGAGSDLMRLGAAASPQAGSTWSQTTDLLETRVATMLSADIALNSSSEALQKLSKGGGRGGVRDFTSQFASGVGSGMTGWGLGVTGNPEMQAPPILPGVGGAMGQSMSYEQYAMSFGLSSQNASPIEQQKMIEQLENMNNKLEQLVNNSDIQKSFIPPWR